jgi:hypothetical protein
LKEGLAEDEAQQLAEHFATIHNWMGRRVVVECRPLSLRQDEVELEARKQSAKLAQLIMGGARQGRARPTVRGPCPAPPAEEGAG